MNDKMIERRAFTRVDYRCPVRLRIGKLVTSGTTANLSLRGARIVGDIASGFRTVGRSCKLALEMGDANTPVRHVVDGCIVRAELGSVSIRFSGMDLETLRHLRGVVDNNSPEGPVSGNELVDQLAQGETELTDDRVNE